MHRQIVDWDKFHRAFFDYHWCASMHQQTHPFIGSHASQPSTSVLIVTLKFTICCVLCSGWCWYHSLTAHQHQKGHTVPKQVIMIATSIQVTTVLHCVRAIRYQAKSEQNVRQDLIPRVHHGEAALMHPVVQWALPGIRNGI